MKGASRVKEKVWRVRRERGVREAANWEGWNGQPGEKRQTLGSRMGKVGEENY